jgi:glycosyltransferase involved in cell wall biosynthesis
MIKFTIVTVTFNAAAVLRRTVASVASQKYQHVEHLIIDGASRDNTLALAETYKHNSDEANNGHEVLITSEPDHGLYDAMNKGIDKATGDYICFLNAGDTFASRDTLDNIASYVGEAEELPAVLFGDTDIVDNDGRFLRHRRLAPPRHLTWKSFRWGMLVCHQSFYARTDLARLVHYNLDYHYSADVDWCIRIMKLAAKRHQPLRNVNIVVTKFLDGGMTNKNHKASLKERFHVMTVHYGLITTVVMHVFFVIRNILKR